MNLQQSSTDVWPIVGIWLLVGGIVVAYIWSLWWLYCDARTRNNTGCMMVALIGLFAWPLGLIIWLLGRPERPRVAKNKPSGTIDCPRCGVTVSGNVARCPNCGEAR
jgi:hypothetical protein